MQLRRDVYLEAAEGLAALLEYLQQTARTDVPFGKAEASLVRQGWLFKTYLVASTDTLIAMNHANATVAAAMLDLVSYRLAVVEIEGDIAIINASLKSIEQFQNEIREEARVLNAAPVSVDSVNRMKSLNERFDATWQRHQEEAHKLEVMTEEHARRLRLLLQRSMAVGLDVQTGIRSALLAARSELGGSIDLDKFGPAASAVDAKMRERVAQTIELIKVPKDPTETTAEVAKS